VGGERLKTSIRVRFQTEVEKRGSRQIALPEQAKVGIPIVVGWRLGTVWEGVHPGGLTWWGQIELTGKKGCGE